MVPNRTVFVTLALLGAMMLYLRYRTKEGQTVAVDAIEEVVVTARRIGSAISDALLPRGIRNNNPGNIEWIENPEKRWLGMIERDGRYGIFDTPENGLRAIGGELAASVRKGQRTVRDVISEWAPPTENNTPAYIAAVAKRLDVLADHTIDVRANAEQITRAIVAHENGAKWENHYTAEQYAAAVRRARA